MQSTGIRVTLATLFTSLALVFSAVPAAAQRAATRAGGFRGWQVDVHGGFMPASRVATGSSELPAPGPTFMTFQNLPSRFVPSWYFGDGALLANQVTTAIGITSRIAALDPVLTTPSVERRGGASVGFRLGHSVTRHALVEFGVDMDQGHLAFTSAALAGIEATRASLKPYFDAVLSRNPNAGNLATSSAATIVNDVGKQMEVVGDVEIRAVPIAGLTPYFTIGGGLVLPRGGSPSATLIGTYDFILNGTPAARIVRGPGPQIHVSNVDAFPICPRFLQGCARRK